MVCKEKNHEHCILDQKCDSQRVLKLVAEKWAVLVIYTLSAGTKRYGQLKREIPDVSQKMLTKPYAAWSATGLWNVKYILRSHQRSSTR